MWPKLMWPKLKVQSVVRIQFPFAFDAPAGFRQLVSNHLLKDSTSIEIFPLLLMD